MSKKILMMASASIGAYAYNLTLQAMKEKGPAKAVEEFIMEDVKTLTVKGGKVVNKLLAEVPVNEKEV